jgi:cobalt/nickel transport system permease protein
MTHMHIPDGILPVWLWISGFLVMAAVLAFCLHRLRGMDRKKKVPLLGVLSAVMLVVMSLEILPIAYHLNLSVAAGILLGPALGFIAAFIVNLMLALMGHGGVTVMGLNTLLLGTEAMLGHTFFYLLRRKLTIFWSAAIATALALVLVTACLIGIVAVSRTDADLFTHGHEVHGAIHERGAAPQQISTFAYLVLSLGLLGWILEAVVTGAVIRFLSQVKPDLLAHILHKDTCRTGSGGRTP